MRNTTWESNVQKLAEVVKEEVPAQEIYTNKPFPHAKFTNIIAKEA